jgi:hypothetical protein
MSQRRFSVTCALAPLLLVFLCLSETMAHDEGTCFPEKPEATVYDIVDEKNEKERLGTAFLVDAKRALFLTARHNLNSSTLRIKRKNFPSYKFKKIASGSNTHLVTEDWALLQAAVANPEVGLYPLPDAQLIYNRPSGTKLTQSVVLGSSNFTLQVGAVKWAEEEIAFGVCRDADVALMEVSSYDKGYSGAPVYSPNMCGVLGVTSRFAVPEEVDDKTRARLIKYFWKYSDKSNPAEGDDISKQYDLIRELLKDKMYVKIVPSSCIVDRLIDLVWRDRDAKSDASKLIRGALRPDASIVVSKMDDFDKASTEQVVTQLADRLPSINWHWVDFLQLSDRFYRGVFVSGWSLELNNFSLMRGAMEKVAERKSYRGIGDSFRAAYKRWKQKYTAQGVSTSSTKATNLLEAPAPAHTGAAFKYSNATWQLNKAATNLGLTFPDSGLEKFSAQEMIEAGRSLTEFQKKVKSGEIKVSEATRSLISDTAIGLLAAGVAKTSQNADQKLMGVGVSRLAQAVQNADQNLVGAGAIRLAQAASSEPRLVMFGPGLDVQLAKAGQALIADPTNEDWKIAADVERSADKVPQMVFSPMDPRGSHAGVPVWAHDPNYSWKYAPYTPLTKQNPAWTPNLWNPNAGTVPVWKIDPKATDGLQPKGG